MMVREESFGQVLYARLEIRAFRNIERFADYKRISTRVRSAMDGTATAHASRGGKSGWRSVLSIKGLTAIIAVGTVVLVLLTLFGR